MNLLLDTGTFGQVVPDELGFGFIGYADHDIGGFGSSFPKQIDACTALFVEGAFFYGGLN